MDILTQLNHAMTYIEAHISDDLALEDVSTVTAYSSYHFGRLFYYIANMSLSDYIRKRKLSLAAMELQSSDAKVIEIALKYGYDSADSFARAFVKQHGVTPSAARQPGVNLTIFPPLTFQIKIKGVQAMNLRIEQKPSFTVVGIKKTFRSDAPVNLVPTFWSDTPREIYDKLLSFINTEPSGFLGLCADFNGKHEFDYYIAVATTKPVPTGLEKLNVPSATWAVLEQNGELMDLANRFWTEWLPSSGYKRAAENIPDIEVYPETDMPKENFKYQLWFPIVKE